MSAIPQGYPVDANEAFDLLCSYDRLSVNDLKILSLIEQFGESFYKGLASNLPSDETRALLERNGQEERGHAHRLQKALRVKGEPFTLPAPEDNPFIHSSNAIAVDKAFLVMLAALERHGDDVYSKWASNEDNEEVATLLRLNAREETRHAERIEQVISML